MPSHPQRLLVTGASGFVGHHALRFLAGVPNGPAAVIALDRTTRHGPGPFTEWVRCDLTDRRQVASALAVIRPDAVLHLAATVGGNDLSATFACNVLAAENLLGEASRLPETPTVLLVGSAAQYGDPGPGSAMLSEDHPLRGDTPYGLSKTLQERWALQYWTTRRLPVICTRPFNLLGPGQSTNLVPGAFMLQIRRFLQGSISHVQVGNLSTRRDFVDVRDLVEAFWALLSVGPGAFGHVFNVASGYATAIQELLDASLAFAGRPVPVQRSAERLKVSDASTVIGDPSKVGALTGWRATIPWQQSLADMWEHLAACESESSG